MNCENCKKQLIPYLLRQMSVIDGIDIYEVECPHCSFKNVLTREGYLNLKDDWIMPKPKPINNKLPSEMNVIFCSLKRCGISWVIRALSEYHKKMFGVPIVFTRDNAEISQQEAKRNNRPLPQGWNNVYDLDPQTLLDKTDPDGNQYDRVVVIQRKKNTLMKAQEIYWNQENIGEVHLKKLKANSLKMYDIIYRDDITDPRYIKVSLEDLNQYPTATMNELMDFLNFPQYMRPPVVDFKPQWFERNWNAISSIYEKGFKFTKRLGRIQDHFKITKDGFLEYLTEITFEETLPKLKNIVIIGPGIHLGCHFSENIYYAFKEKGYNVDLLSLDRLGFGTKEGTPYNDKHEMYSLSKALEQVDFTPDLILFDEPYWNFHNNQDIPVMYFHRDFMRNPAVYYPTVSYFWHHETITDFQKRLGHPHWSNKASDLRVMYPAIEPKNFDLTQEKTLKGVTCLSGRESMRWCLERWEHKAAGYLTQTNTEIKEFMESGLQWIESDKGGLEDYIYRAMLPQCESLWICLPFGQFISRRMLEAMYCKAVCFVKIEGKIHENILKEMGFYPNEHYVKIEAISDLVEIQKSWNIKDYEDMIEKAYEVVVNEHLFEHRVEFIEKEFKTLYQKRLKVE